jgi:hypothetical protein
MVMYVTTFREKFPIVARECGIKHSIGWGQFMQVRVVLRRNGYDVASTHQFSSNESLAELRQELVSKVGSRLTYIRFSLKTDTEAGTVMCEVTYRETSYHDACIRFKELVAQLPQPVEVHGELPARVEGFVTKGMSVEQAWLAAG